LRNDSITSVKDVKAGDHLCILYRNAREHRRVLTDFISQGIERGERIFYVLDANTGNRVRGYLEKAGWDPADLEERGQLLLLSAKDSYLLNGTFDPDRMIRMLGQETKKALSEGYSALRVTGEMTWALRGTDPETLIEYEAKLNEFFPKNKCLAICQYDMRRFDAGILQKVLMTHPIAIIGDNFYDNPYYVFPRAFLGKNREREILYNWIDNMRERSRIMDRIRRNEEELIAERDRAQTYLDIAGVIFVALDERGTVQMINRKGCQVLGYREDEIVGKNWFEGFFPERIRKEVRSISRSLLSGDVEGFDDLVRPIMTKNGEERMIAWSNTVIQNDDGEIIGLLSSGRDITERKAAQDLLVESEQKHRTLFETMSQGVVYKDALGNIISANSAAERILGLSLDEMNGVTSQDPRWKPIRPDGSDFPGDMHPSMVALRTGKEVKDVTMGICNQREDRCRWILVTATPRFKNGEKKPYQVYTTFTDLTDQIENQRRLSSLSQMVEQSTDGIIQCDRDYKITYMNPTAEALFGWKLEEIRGKRPDIFNADQHSKEVQKELYGSMERGDIFSGESLNMKKNGTTFYCHYKVSPLRDENGDTIGFLGIQRDVSELRAAEGSLRASLEEKEILLREIHHRVKNNMQIMTSLLSLQCGYLDDQDAISALMDCQDRMAAMSLIHEMLYRSGNLSRIDLGEFVQDMMAQIYRSRGIDVNRIAMVVQIQDITLDINNAIPMGLMINEIVTNSLKHAFPHQREGHVKIEAKVLKTKLKVQISDNGIGLPEGFSMDRTNTLGMQMLGTLTRQIRGKISIKGKKGTKFIIDVPLKGKV